MDLKCRRPGDPSLCRHAKQALNGSFVGLRSYAYHQMMAGLFVTAKFVSTPERSESRAR
jgi:hypothetical protein